MYIYIHTYIHACIHTYIHTHINIIQLRENTSAWVLAEIRDPHVHRTLQGPLPHVKHVKGVCEAAFFDYLLGWGTLLILGPLAEIVSPA